jgi:hypothetical protein
MAQIPTQIQALLLGEAYTELPEVLVFSFNVNIMVLFLKRITDSISKQSAVRHVIIF